MLLTSVQTDQHTHWCGQCHLHLHRWLLAIPNFYKVGISTELWQEERETIKIWYRLVFWAKKLLQCNNVTMLQCYMHKSCAIYLIALNKIAKVLFFRFSFFFKVFSSIVADRSHACFTVIAWELHFVTLRKLYVSKSESNPIHWGESTFCHIEENLGEEAGKEEWASSRC